METKSSTNVAPRRRGLSRRASLSALPTYADDDPSTKKFGFNKKELYLAYKEEKKMRKEAHDKVEQEMRKAIEDVKFEPVSGLAEETETMVTKVKLDTFSRPKASRRSRRASMGMPLRILTPPSSPKLNLEDINAVEPVPTSPLPVAPFSPDRRSMLKKSFSCEDAEALAGWRTVSFDDGPLGLKLEPTVGEKAARVTGFIDTAGLPSAAKATGQISFNDVIVKINSTLPKSFEETLMVLSEGGIRKITFRPYFDYEIEGLDDRKMKKKKSKKSLFDDFEPPKKSSHKKKSKKASLQVEDDPEEDREAVETKKKKGSRIEIAAFDPAAEPKKEKSSKSKKDKSSSKHKKSSSKHKKKDTSNTETSDSDSSSS